MSIKVNSTDIGSSIKLNNTDLKEIIYNGDSIWKSQSRIILARLPYDFEGGSAVFWNDEIHIFGANPNTNYTQKHYKWNGSSWVSVSTLPYKFYTSKAVVYNNEIHIMNFYILGSSTDRYKHYKWNGSRWVADVSLPYLYPIPVICNDTFYLVGGGMYTPSTGAFSNATDFYKLTNNGWERINASLPIILYQGCAVALNGEIHIMGGTNNNYNKRSHYKWNGSNWSYVSELPYDFNATVAGAVVLNNEIHLLGFTGSNANYGLLHYKWNGSRWISQAALPYTGYYISSLVANDDICILGGYSTTASIARNVGQFNNGSWSLVT